jgi:hypothetical protein
MYVCIRGGPHLALELRPFLTYEQADKQQTDIIHGVASQKIILLNITLDETIYFAVIHSYTWYSLGDALKSQLH